MHAAAAAFTRVLDFTTTMHAPPRSRDPVKKRTLRLALVGAWIVGLSLGAILLVATRANEGLAVALLAVVAPVYLASTLPYCADAWRNRRFSPPVALLWAWAVLYLPPIVATIYWWRYVRARE